MSYPLPGFHFQVEWGGTKIGFSEISGLEAKTEVIQYRTGSSPEYSTLKMPGMRSFGNITLKRGIFAADNEFFEWFNTVSLNTIERRDLTVSLLNEEHEPVMVWKIKNAWPAKVDGPKLNSSENTVAYETITLVHEGLSIQNE
jgi:phage tail-like protein